MAVALLLAAPIPYASAFPDPSGCGDESITFRFDTTVPSNKHNLIADAFQEWLDVDDWDTFRSVDSMSWNQSTGEWTVEMEDLNGYGAMLCNDREIKLDDSLINDDVLLSTISTHEMGHALGLSHTGLEDSFNGDIPVMGICDYDGMEVAQDDRGNVVRLHGDLSPPTIHANAGFEMGSKKYWGRSSVSSSWDVSTLNKEDGDYNLRFRPTANYGYVYQTMNVADVESDTEFDARVNYRKISSSSTTGDMRMQILARRVEYGTTSEGQCEYNQFTRGTHHNQNVVNHSQYGFSVVRTEYFTPTTSWQIEDEPTAYAPDLAWEGVDLRIRIGSKVKYTSSGSYATVNIDTTRVRLRTTS